MNNKLDFVIQLFENVVLDNNYFWLESLVNIKETCVLEWWYENKKLTVYVDDEFLDIYKRFATESEYQIEDIQISLSDVNENRIEELWEWLFQDSQL